MATVPLHPEIEALREFVPVYSLSDESLPTIRQTLAAPPPELSDEVTRVDQVIDEDTGVFVRVHIPNGLDGPVPCLYAIHGGGYVVGSVDMLDEPFDSWCREFGIVGVAIGYRRAPEHPYPAPLEDCYAGLEWTFEHADELGIDPSAVGTFGTSAGGGLCAALNMLVRDRGELDVQFQLLLAPMLDDRQQTASSQLDDLIVWSTASNEYGWRSYLGELYGSDDVPPYAAPARADDLAGLPEAYVSVGGADGFRDEDIDYAMRLYDAGVPTELHVYPGAPHGVSRFVGTELATRVVADRDDWLRRQFARIR